MTLLEGLSSHPDFKLDLHRRLPFLVVGLEVYVFFWGVVGCCFVVPLSLVPDCLCRNLSTFLVILPTFPLEARFFSVVPSPRQIFGSFSGVQVRTQSCRRKYEFSPQKSDGVSFPFPCLTLSPSGVESLNSSIMPGLPVRLE